MKDIGVQALGRSLMEMKNLEKLFLRDVGITAKSIELLYPALMKLENLKVLDLSENELKRSACIRLLDHLQLHCPNLEELHLARTEASSVGISTLFQNDPEFRKLPKLKILDLRENMIDDQGARSLLNVLVDRTNLLKVELDGNQFTPEMVASLSSRLSHIMGSLEENEYLE